MVPSLSSHRTELYDTNTFFAHAASLHQGSPHCAIFPTAASRRSLDRVSVPMWPFTLSGRLLIVALVGCYLTNQLISGESIFDRSSLITLSCESVMSSGINPGFPRLSLCLRQVTHLLLTRPPLIQDDVCPRASVFSSSLDLHVLGAPPAFVLSQDQTLDLNFEFAQLFVFH